MSQFVTAAILHQQMPANQIRQTHAVLDAIMPGHRAAWSKLGACKDIADLLEQSAVLQGKTRHVGDYIVETDQFRGTVQTIHTKKNFCWLRIVMDAEVERALAGDPNFLCDVVSAVGEGEA